MVEIVNVALIIFMLFLAVAALRVRELISAVFLLGAYSFFIAVLFSLLKAVDVSFTEAMVGVGASTIFWIVAIFRTKHVAAEGVLKPYPLVSFIFIALLGALFIWGSLDLPLFGDIHSAASTYLSPHYLQNSLHDSHTPNAVTAIVVDYRGFDTLIEATVIFTAGVACLLIMRKKS